MREKQGPHDSHISQLRAKIVAKRVASQIKGQRDTLRGIERLLAGGKVPGDFDTLTPAVRAYLGALEDIRKSAEAATLPPATLRRMFGLGFTLDQFRRDIGDMIEIAQEVPKPRPGLVAAMRGWWLARA